MAKYNLLEDDDIFDEEFDDKQNDSVEEEKPAAAPEVTLEDELDINLDDELLQIDEDDEDDTTTDFQSLDIEDLELENETIEEEIVNQELQEDDPYSNILDQGLEEPSAEPALEQEPEPTPEPTPEPEGEEKKEKIVIPDDYEDDKQEGVNYKPVILGVAAVLLLIIGYFVIDAYVLNPSVPDMAQNDKEKSATETPKSTAETQKANEAKKREAFLATVSGPSKQKLNMALDVVSSISGEAALSSMLIYGNSMMFEVFGQSRSDIAKVNMNLKETMPAHNFEVIYSNKRSGTEDNTMGLFKSEIPDNAAGGSGKAKKSFSSVGAFQEWVSNNANVNGLKVDRIQNRKTGSKESFTSYEVEAVIKGPKAGCNTLTGKLASDVNQAKINKLNMSAVDQKSFQSDTYQLTLILEIFI